MEPHDAWRFAGAVIGTALAFLVAWPTSRKDFASRLIVSIVCGVVFSPVLRTYFEWPDFPRLALASAVVCSLSAWSVIGAGMRILQSTSKWPPWRR